MSEMNNFEDELKDLEDVWKDAQSRKEKQSLPDGEYTLFVYDMYIRKHKSKDPDREFDISVITEFRTLTEPIITVPKWCNLSDPNRAGFFKDMLDAMEIAHPAKLTMLPDIFDKCKDLVVECRVQNDGRYCNIYVQRLSQSNTPKLNF